MADLLVRGAVVVATTDHDRRELEGGWVAITDGLVEAVGGAHDAPPDAARVLDASGCLVTPGLINTHHHMYQNLTRSFRPAVNGSLFEWLTTLYPRWALLDEEAAYVSAWVGLAELALGGCTTSTDHLYVHPRGGGDLISAEIRAARELGMRFHPTRGSMSLSEKDGGLPPDSVVQDDDEILADSERLVAQHHDRTWGAMVRIALGAVLSVLGHARADARHGRARGAPRRSAAHPPGRGPRRRPVCRARVRAAHHRALRRRRVGERPGVGRALHLSEPGRDRPARRLGYGCCALPELEHADRRRWNRPGCRAACSGCAGRSRVRRFGFDRLRIALDGGAQRFAARTVASGPGLHGARDALEIATRGSAACLGRAGELGELSAGAAGDLVCWSLEGIAFAGALTDPVEAWLRCGPVSARHTVVNGRLVVEDAHLVAPGEEEMLRRHRAISARIQGVSSSPW